MLQTFILLGILAVAIGVGIWMAGFGHRMYRIFAILFGLGLGAYGVLFIAGQLGFAVSMPVYIVAAVAGIGLAVLAFLFRPVGMGVGGLILGIFYGVGIVFTADILTGGAIPAVAYTGVSVLLMGLCVAYCIARPDNGGMLTTSLIGSYAISLSIALIVLWFVSGGLNPANLISQKGNFFEQGVALYQMITADSRIFLLGFSAALGILFFLLQRSMFKRREEQGDYFDDLDDAFPLPDTPEPSEDFDDDDAYFANSKRKKHRRHKKPLDDWEDEQDGEPVTPAAEYQDTVEPFDSAIAQPAAEQTPAAADAKSDMPTVDAEATVVQPVVMAQTPPSTGGQTQVFRRVPAAEETADAAQPEQQAPAVQQEAAEPARPHASMERPSFAPRSSRRR